MERLVVLRDLISALKSRSIVLRRHLRKVLLSLMRSLLPWMKSMLRYSLLRVVRRIPACYGSIIWNRVSCDEWTMGFLTLERPRLICVTAAKISSITNHLQTSTYAGSARLGSGQC
jgi:hypothetical protein